MSASKLAAFGRMEVVTLASSRQDSSGGWGATRLALGSVFALLAGLGCEDAKRCWEDGTCPSSDGGAGSSQELSATFEDSAASSDATPSGVTADGATTGTADVSTADGATTSIATADGTTGDGATTSGGLTTAGESSAHDGGGSTGSDSVTITPDSSAASVTDSTDWVGDTSAPESSSGSDASCASDTTCGGLVCVAGACEVCDPGDHRGCETSGTGRRCRASEGGNSCVTCIPGDSAPATIEVCGLNDRGSPMLECVNGVWQTTSCSDPDVCTDADTQVGSTPCGPNGSGLYLANCSAGQWVDETSSCIDDDQCVNGTLRASDSECGFSGYLEQLCVNGEWLTQSNRCLECLRKYRVPDPLFESALADRNNIKADPVDPASVGYMVSLDLSFSSIQDATGIQCFTSLRDLNLAKNQLSDLTPLASLTELRSLSLAYNQLYGSSLAPLGALTELTYLSVEATSVQSLDGLQTLTKLEELRAVYNHITDVSPLVPLTALQNLGLEGNPYVECESSAFATLKARIPTFYSDCP